MKKLFALFFTMAMTFPAFSEVVNLPLPDVKFTQGSIAFAPNITCGEISGPSENLYLINEGRPEKFSVGESDSLSQVSDMAIYRGQQYCVQYKRVNGENKIEKTFNSDVKCGKLKSSGSMTSITNNTGDHVFPMGGSPSGDRFRKEFEELLGARAIDDNNYCVYYIEELNDAMKVVGASIFDYYKGYKGQ